MSQIRYFDYLLDHSQITLSRYLLDVMPTGIYTGCDISLSIDTRISPGKYMASNGIFIEETADVVFGSIPSTSPGIPLTKTLIGLGPELNTVQRTAFEYSIVDGLLTDVDFLTSTRPYIIFGWIKFDGFIWSFVNSNKQQHQIKTSLDIKLNIPIPGVVPDEILNIPAVGPSARTAIVGTKTFNIVLNNRFPVKTINFAFANTANITLDASIENEYVYGPAHVIGTIPSNPSPFVLSFNLAQENLSNALLTLVANGTGDVDWNYIEIIQEPSFI